MTQQFEPKLPYLEPSFDAKSQDSHARCDQATKAGRKVGDMTAKLFTAYNAANTRRGLGLRSGPALLTRNHVPTSR